MIDSAKVNGSMQIPPQLQGAYQKIVLAGMKVMFDKNTHQMAMQELEKQGPVSDNLAEGIINLMALLWQKSNKTMPPQLIIPAGITLLMEAADFIKKSQIVPIEPQDLGDATQKFVMGIMKKFGLNPDAVIQKAQQLTGGQGV
jgi:ABC-type dipeptide/oligopeptide/nickel transport system ATPase subunit